MDAVDPGLFTPSVDQVQALLVARGPFSATSTPTSTEVQQRATDVACELAGEFTEMPESLLGLATSVVLYKTAADIEAGAFPEQQAAGASSGPIWYARYVQAHDRLVAEATALSDTPSTTGMIFAPSGTALAWAQLEAADQLAGFTPLPDWSPEF